MGGLLLVYTSCLLVGAPAEALTLTRDGAAQAVIVVAADAPAPVQTAAKELQQHLAGVTGATFPIVAPGAAPAGTTQVLVGPSERLRAAAPDLDLAAVGEGIVLRTVAGPPPALILAGPPPRGTLNAVYTFLEDVVGVRWWSSTETDLPRRPTVEVPALDVTYAPPLRVREAFYRDAQDGVFSARMRLNGHFHRVPAEYGGHYRILGWCHTFYQLLPPKDWFAQHPEWYSEIDGQRRADRTQLCLTNEAMRAELTRRALEWIAKEPEAGMISISQNDWGGACQCAACRAVEAEEGSPAGPLIRFVNAVAADIEAQHPGFLVETLAYHYTRPAPKLVKPRANVVVRLCSIECDFARPLMASETNAAFRADIEAWSAIAPNLYIWDYVTNFRNYVLPHPNLAALAPNVRAFVDHHAIGLFEQGDSYSNVGDFVRLRAWLLAHLMWNPRQDEGKLLDTFLNGYYGAAGPHLRAYLDHLQAAVERSGAYLRCYMEDSSPWLSPTDLAEAARLYAQAEAAVAGDPVRAKRVRRERLSLDYAWLQRDRSLRRLAQREGRPYAGPKDPAALAAEFVAVAREHGAGGFREGGSFEAVEQDLLHRFQPPAPLPALLAGTAPEDLLDFQEGEFTLHGAGNWVTVVDDPAASNGRAARMPGTHTQWAVQRPLNAELAGPDRWHVWLLVRADATGTEGKALTAGLYDSAARKGMAQREVSLEDLAAVKAGEYLPLDLGVHTLGDGQYLWVAPAARPDAVQAVYVDRMVLVRER